MLCRCTVFLALLLATPSGVGLLWQAFVPAPWYCITPTVIDRCYAFCAGEGLAIPAYPSLPVHACDSLPCILLPSAHCRSLSYRSFFLLFFGYAPMEHIFLGTLELSISQSYFWSSVRLQDTACRLNRTAVLAVGGSCVRVGLSLPLVFGPFRCRQLGGRRSVLQWQADGHAHCMSI